MEEGKIRCAIFPSNTPRDLVLSKNGICLDNFSIKSGGYVNLVGNFRLEATFSNTKVVKETLKQGCILKICDEYGNDEIFRITNISNNNKMVVTIIAFQITITDTKTSWLKDVRPTKCSGLSALQKMYNESESNGFRKELFINSDIRNKSTAYFQDMNLYDAIHTCDQSFISRWGGEISRNKYTLTINKRIGQDNGVTIREGKNLLGFKSKTDLSSVITVAIGKGYDGIKGDYIESPYKNKYPGANTKVIEYSDVKVRTESDNSAEGFATLQEAKAELNRRVKEEFSKNHIDELKATYEIDFLDLSKTEEYKDYVQAERVNIGDIVRVIVDSLDLILTTRVIEKEIDYLSGRVTKITLSNNPVSITKSDAEIISGIRNLLIKNNNSDLSNYIDAMMKSGIKDSYVVNRLNETLWMDNQDINLAKNVVKVNKNGLFFSQTGYNGKYTCGFTIDGALNANIIQTGILSTILIKSSDGDNYWDLNTGYMKIKNGYIDGGESYWDIKNNYFYLNGGVIGGKNGNFEMDLRKDGEVTFKNNGKDAVKIHNNAIDMFNHSKNGDFIGGLQSLCLIENEILNVNKPFIGLVNDFDSAISIAYKKSDTTFTSYITFDKYNILNNYSPIRIQEDISMGTNNIKFGREDEIEMYASKSKLFSIKSKGLYIYDDKILLAQIEKDKLFLPFIAATSDNPNFWIKKNVVVDGDMGCTGTKNRVVETKTYGKVKLNAIESTECLFTDIGRGKLKNGTCIIKLDHKFSETVNTNVEYEVFLQPYGNANIWVDTKNMYPRFFKVEGTNDIEFAYEIKAKQRGYEDIRLEEVTKNK